MMEEFFENLRMDTIEQLANLVAKNDLEEISIRDGSQSITIKAKRIPPPPPMPMATPAAQPEPAPAPQPRLEKPEKVIRAPIVGTYYAAAAPDQPPFVKEGDNVKIGDVVMIIESMKLMNEVQSDLEGTVEKILVKNGDPVEYDQAVIVLS